ncbi:MAG: hypothetical protein ACSHW1_14595 [Yoonia sp.]|uniref:hypothetical protein n=1 Tax=Yoonia sp. TaxID=2212373 RepID=UPI003EF18168
MKFTIVVLSLAILTGCSLPPESAAWFRNTSQQEILAFYEQRCSGYGYKAETDEMRECVADEIRSARERNANISAGVMSGILAD